MTGSLATFIILTLCLLLSFLLSGMEAGAFALNRLRVRRLARGGNSQAQLLNDFLEKPERFLWTILVGNTLVNLFILGWVITKLHGRLIEHPVWITILFVIIVFFFYAFFDLLPKMLFRAYSNRLCLAPRAFDAEPGSVCGGRHFKIRVALERLADIHRTAFRQPRGNARCDGGGCAGADP